VELNIIATQHLRTQIIANQSAAIQLRSEARRTSGYAKHSLNLGRQSLGAYTRGLLLLLGYYRARKYNRCEQNTAHKPAHIVHLMWSAHKRCLGEKVPAVTANMYVQWLNEPSGTLMVVPPESPQPSL